MTLTLKLANQSLHMTLAHDDVSPCQVCLGKNQQFRRYHLDKQSSNFLTFAVVTLTLNKDFYISQDNFGLWLCTIKLSLVKKKINRSENMSYFDCMTLHYLGLEDTNQSFHLSLKLMMMHHYTKFGNEGFSSSEAIVWTTIIDILNLRCDHNFEQSIPIFW